MCGIAGCHFGARGFDEDDRARLVAMRDALVHRGPDGSGLLLREGYAFTHTRLAVRDTSAAGDQPMRHASGAAITYNGELYAIEALRGELERGGERFAGTSDTEVLLAHVARQGVDETLPRIHGMFAFAFGDAAGQRVTLARDRMGIKPLYYAADGRGRTWFASEIGALAAHAPIDAGLDEDALALFALYGFVPGPSTVHRAVRALPPGHALALGEPGTAAPRRFAPEDPPREDFSLADAAARVKEALSRAVLRQMVADVPLGAFLSGGIDSSAVAALVREAGRELQTFTIGYADEPAIDESRWAELVARHLGTRHTLFVVEPGDVRRALVECVARQGQPFADPSMVPTYLVAKLARQHVTVALSGDGADELFAGYAKYRTETARARLRGVPPALVDAGARLAEWLPATRFSKAGERARKVKKLAAAVRLPGAERWSALQAILPVRERALALFSPALRNAARVPAAVAAAIEEHGDGLFGMLAADRRVTLVDRMLAKVDLASMASSLEVRVPFLDDEVVDLALRLPEAALLSAGQGKRALREAILPMLPPEVRARPKQGFDFPAGRWLAGPLATEFWDHVRSREARAFIDVDAVESLFARHREGREAADHALWTVFALAVWLAGGYRSSP